MTKNERAKIARNAIEHGLRAETLKHFAPPSYVALCNEDRRDYYQLLDELVSVYQPVNLVAAGIARHQRQPRQIGEAFRTNPVEILATY